MTARYEQIAEWVNRFDWIKGAELGVFDGRTHFYLLQHCSQLTLVGVDVWDMPGFSEGPTKSGERCFCKYCSETRSSRKSKTITQMKNEVIIKTDPSRAIIIIGETVAASKRINDRELDFVFVDADHSREGVSSDIEAWLPKIRDGGRIIGHDANMKSVMDAVHLHFGKDEIKFGDDHLWYVNC